MLKTGQTSESEDLWEEGSRPKEQQVQKIGMKAGVVKTQKVGPGLWHNGYKALA